MANDLYVSGAYLEKNPTWHTDESPWKTREVLRMLRQNALSPTTICEVGCGAGEIPRLMQQEMPATCQFWGYDISPQAFELCRHKENERLHFKLADFLQEEDMTFDLILLMDVVEHVEDCYGFLRNIKPKSQYKIIQVPMDLSAQSLIFGHVAGYRERSGHLHFFTRETALAMLKDLGYEVLDSFYTATDLVDVESKWITHPAQRLRHRLGRAKLTLTQIPAKFFFTLNKDLAVRTWGHWGMWRLLILAR